MNNREQKQTWIYRFFDCAGIDFHILRTLLFRCWSIIAGGITALLIPIFISPEQQGYYYTFSAVLATQIFFELGLNHVLTQLTSHAVAFLKCEDNFRLQGNPRWIHAIASLLILSKRWHVIMASLFFFILLVGGWLFFSNKGKLPVDLWLGAWVVLVGAAAINLAMSARLAICEGLGEVGNVARLRLGQSVLGYMLLWGLLLSGRGLWCVTAVPVISALTTLWWLSKHKTISFLHEFSEKESDSSIDFSTGYTYWKDIFPLQWKIALSWASGYFIFSFLTPVIFSFQGAAAAGQLGLSLTIFSAISTLGFSWISAKVPQFSMYIARSEREKLNQLFDAQAIRCLSITVLCVSLFILFVKIGSGFIPKIHERLPSLSIMMLLGTVTISNVIIFMLAAYMRAHKEEPLTMHALASAFLIGVGVYWGASISLVAAVAAYTLVTLLVSLPWCILIYKKYRRRIK